MDTRLIEVFFEVQRGLPRQGPGHRESTLRALALCSDAPDCPTLLDIGCGPGAQTMVLAGACSGRITAVDNCDEYLDELRRRTQEAGVAGRVEALNADMTDLGLPEASFDIIWCEAAAYSMGVSAALKAWRPLLRERGYLALSELVWLEENPPSPAADFWREGYPAMTDAGGVREMIHAAGYRLIGDFTLPDEAWWTDYYTPLEAKLPSLREKYVEDAQALEVITATEAEIETRRRYGASYGYHFFVLTRPQ